MDALLIEAELLLDWYLPQLGAAVAGRSDAAHFQRCGAMRCVRRIEAPRDLGAARLSIRPNLLWLPEREGIARSACSISRTP